MMSSLDCDGPVALPEMALAETRESILFEEGAYSSVHPGAKRQLSIGTALTSSLGTLKSW